MNTAVFYFSGAGNTAWAAKTLNRQLKAGGYACALYRIDSDLSDNDLTGILASAKLLGFAYPLYGANIPRIMRVFMQRIVSLAEAMDVAAKDIFFINAFSYVNGHGVFNAKAHFQALPFKTIGYINLRLTNTAPAKDKSRALVGDRLPDKIKQKATLRLGRFVRRLSAGKRTINGVGPHLFVGILIRRILRDEIKKNHRHMRVDMEKCTDCMLCVKNCPVSCISFAKGTFAFSSACEACMRCYNHCPEKAISNFK